MHRNIYNKEVKRAKQNYYSNKLTIKSNKKDIIDNKIPTTPIIKPEFQREDKLWNTVKELTNSNRKQPPRVLNHNNSVVTSIKKSVISQTNFMLIKYHQ